MCLGKITKVYKPSLYNLWIPKFAYKSGVGWKTFMQIGGNFKSNCQGIFVDLPLNEFLNEYDYREVIHKKRKLIYNDKESYSFGWHIYLEPANIYSTKVEYNQGHTIGIDTNRKTIVAKYMKILED